MSWKLGTCLESCVCQCQLLLYCQFWHFVSQPRQAKRKKQNKTLLESSTVCEGSFCIYSNLRRTKMSNTPQVVDGEASESDSEIEIGLTPVSISLILGHAFQNIKLY